MESILVLEGKKMVRMDGLEPSCLAAHAPQTCVSTNFTTSAVESVISAGVGVR
ncbi:MAG: hypothetical protein RI953_1624, partial [Pseudomonadota bacterium]